MTDIKLAFTHRQCPGCGFLIDVKDFLLLTHNHRCVRCAAFHLTEFKGVVIGGFK